MNNGLKVNYKGEAELLEASIRRIAAEYHVWFAQYKLENIEESRSMTEVPDLCRGSLGVKGRYTLKVKAMATRALVPFTLHLLRKFGTCLPYLVLPLPLARLWSG